MDGLKQFIETVAVLIVSMLIFLCQNKLIMWYSNEGNNT